MRRHISVQRATTKYFSNSFVFKLKIEKEELQEIVRLIWARTNRLQQLVHYVHFSVFSAIWGICFSLKANPNGTKNIAFWHTVGTGDAPALRSPG
jgi:hypothetical protein